MRQAKNSRDTICETGIETALNPFLPLPKHISLQNDPLLEAAFFARKWERAKTDKQKERIINGLMLNAGSWDIITRSCVYYKEFENLVGLKFPGFWR